MLTERIERVFQWRRGWWVGLWNPLRATIGCRSLLLLSLVSTPGGEATELEVTAIANAGFLARSGEQSVLLDALFRATGPYPEFYQQAPTEALLRSIIEGEAAFAQIDFALVSHHHADHHDARTAVDFLERNEAALVVGPPAVRATMAEVRGFDAVADRVRAPILKDGECTELEATGISITVCQVGHSGSPDVGNFIYFIDLGGCRIVHEGDAELSASTISELGSARLSPDVAFLHSWWVTSDEGRRAVLEGIRPQAVVVTHHRWAMADAVRKRLEGLSTGTPGSRLLLTAFGAEGESGSFACRESSPRKDGRGRAFEHAER